ncbi:MAG: hypothetical protein NC246_15210 [Muribaculaceae bacterium]|nr:hypothetical protein [Muribaculaceae bacterium]
MSVSGIGQNYYQNYVTENKHISGKEKFALEKTDGTKELSEAEEMELFKKEFYEDLSKITSHGTVSNAAVNISEAAFKAMKDDPGYREKVLSLIQRDWGDSYAPRNCSVLVTVGATLNEYRADSWPVGSDFEFDACSQNSFYKRTNEKKNRQQELLEKYLEKRAQMKKQQQEMLDEKAAKVKLEKSRMSQSRISEMQMAKAANAYDANVMTETAAESRGASGKTDSSVWAGDMVIWQPPNYSGFTYDSSISSKSKEEMTMDEYKQWFMNETSQMPVSAWVRSTIVGGSLTITEECFERMKNDPEWENTVLGMVRKMYSVNGIMGAKAIGYQVIGASPEQCYGEGIPVKSGSPFSADKGESWWEKRHRKMEELMEEQEKEAVKKAQARRAQAQAISAFSRRVAGSRKI